ncbi:hypothetical protein VDGE_06993 [Verticillium dahliae]|uniref:Necrosis-and ethylene-inducing protein n=1 Tax=Verticillium dahliae TaxID=27337 RepID=A0A444SBB9_VERDA|nr:hypothetical protein VDGE_06993 [Verticillium dahliae]
MVSKIFSTLASIALVAAGPVSLRAVVPHDSLNPVTQRVQTGAIGDAIAKFNPLLHIANGCQPYTAVNDAGDTSGGLQDSGNISAGCRDQSKGQTYARAKVVNGQLAIMYSFYMPKDQPIAGNVAGGHRHDWENIVVFVDDPAANAAPGLLGGAASGHGEYKKTATPDREGDSVKVEYFTTFPTNHELQFTATTGKTYPISDWDAMPQAARDALETTDFGSANVPFKDANFDSNLAKAAL